MVSKIKNLYNFVIVKHKKLTIIIGVITIILITIIGTGYFYYGIGMSEQHKNDRIKSVVLNKEYDKATEMTNRYFNKTDEQSIAIKKVNMSLIDLCKTTNTGSLEEATSKYKALQEQLNTVKIIKVDITKEKYNSSYHNVEVTVQNNGKENINYVKIGLDFKDKNGNIIQSDWTNDSSVIKPNAKQTIKKMVSNDIKYDTVQAEVQDFR
jgi:archaellum component FlaF (FlaF/FlaG flagellin family)